MKKQNIRYFDTCSLVLMFLILICSSAHAIGSYTVGNRTVIDQGTGLAYCEQLSLNSEADWRLPNIRELKSLVDYSKYYPAVDPSIPCRISIYWSSTSVVNSPSTKAWSVFFGNGDDIWKKKTEKLAIRCVRGVFQGVALVCPGMVFRSLVPRLSVPILQFWSGNRRLRTICSRTGSSTCGIPAIKSILRKKSHFCTDKVHGKARTPITLVRDLLGHTDLKTTEIYLSVIGQEKRNLVMKAWAEQPLKDRLKAFLVLQLFYNQTTVRPIKRLINNT